MKTLPSNRYDLTELKSLMAPLGFRWFDEPGAFPEEACTLLIHPAEPRALEAPRDQRFLLLWVDSRFHRDSCGFSLGSPYVCPDLEEPDVVLHGWSDDHGNFTDSASSPIHDDYRQVVGWKPVVAGYVFRPTRPGEVRERTVRRP